MLAVGRRNILRNASGIINFHIRKSSHSVKVLYDGGCPICVKEISLLKYLDKNKNNVNFIDISTDEYDASTNCGITREDAMKQMTVIDESGEVVTRVAAFRTMYEAVGLGWLLAITRLPGISHLAEIGYDWFARNRLRITGREECENGSCSKRTENR